MKNKRQIGNRYEDMAQEYLVRNGYTVIDRNFSCMYGEIDIIAKENHTLVFIEVKYRNSDRFGMPVEAVDERKQHKIIMSAEYYRMKHNISDRVECRFDVVSIFVKDIEIIKNAFGGLT